MTEAERRALRALVDQARRAALAASELRCEWCGELMPPHPSGIPKRFCCKNHRVRAWYRDTERGRRAAAGKKRRRAARRRATA